MVMDGEEGVMFVKKNDGREKGDEFVIFNKEDDEGKDMRKKSEIIGYRYIEMLRRKKDEVKKVLNR